MKIYRPIKTNVRTQKFGESKACQYPNGKVVSKIGNSCPYGSISLYEKLGLKGHNGEDWNTIHGEPLFFPVVAETEWYAKHEKDWNGGLGVDIISTRPILDGKYVKFRFWHLKGTVLHDGQVVRAGQFMGYCDNTGLSSGDHLHWSMKIVDSKGRTQNRDNGYSGAIDFSEYFENEFILNTLGISDSRVSVMYRTLLRVMHIWLAIFSIK